MLVQEPVESAIWHCLNHYAYNDAIFLAERLYHEKWTDDCLFLVATCYYRAGNKDKSYNILKTNGARTSSTKYLLAKCAVDLKKDFEAESILLGTILDHNQEINMEDFLSTFGDKASFALQLLSGIYQRSERRKKACDIQKKLLNYNPFLWSAFQNICDNGEIVTPNSVFDLDNIHNFAFTQGNNPLVNLVNSSFDHMKDIISVVESGPVNCPTTTPCSFNTTMGPTLPNLGTPDNFNSCSMNESASINESSVGWNTLASTPMGVGGGGISGIQISGINFLNSTTDSDIGKPGSAGGLMPAPPIKAKIRRFKPNISSSNNISNPCFGMGGSGLGSPLCRTNGFNIRTLEFSASPQILLLTPTESSKPKMTTPVVPPKYPVLTESPLTPCSRSPTPSTGAVITDDRNNIKRVAMANKPNNNGKQSVLGQSGNLITPQNTVPTRRSSRLFTTQSVKENSKSLDKRISNRSPTRKVKSRISRAEKQILEVENNEKNRSLTENKVSETQQVISESEKVEKCKSGRVHSRLTQEAIKLQRSSASGLMSLLRLFGFIYAEVSRYNFREAIKRIQQLPEQHAKSSWVMSLLGKCYFELSEYREAADYLRQVREQDPYRLEMMDYYSTALWHLQDDVRLSGLAQDLIDKKKLDPVSWCVAANCFSHHKDHETAIRFLQRAVQLDSDCTYAYTLLGHEYVLTEEFEKGLVAFRTAARLNPRHYNAWYGIGLIFAKQERYQLAEYHIVKALSISPLSPKLMCHLASVQHKLNKTEKALQTINNAMLIAPKNALCKFERASILHKMERYPEALEELLVLKDIVPKESAVYSLLGKVHKKLGNIHSAMAAFSWARDLDPKGASTQIKDVLDPGLSWVEEESGNDEMECLEGSSLLPGASSGMVVEDSSFSGENNYSLGVNQLTTSTLNESDESL